MSKYNLPLLFSTSWAHLNSSASTNRSRGLGHGSPRLPCIQFHHHGGELQAHANTMALPAYFQSLRAQKTAHLMMRNSSKGPKHARASIVTSWLVVLLTWLHRSILFFQTSLMKSLPQTTHYLVVLLPSVLILFLWSWLRSLLGLMRDPERKHPEVRHAKNSHCSSYLTPIYINTPHQPLSLSAAWQPAPMATAPTSVWGEYQCLMGRWDYEVSSKWSGLYLALFLTPWMQIWMLWMFVKREKRILSQYNSVINGSILND